MRGTCALSGLRVEVDGAPPADRPILFVCNHVSYMDIPALGSVLDGLFVSKKEVADWPLLGWLARVARTIFVDRRRTRAAADCHLLAHHLLAGEAVVLFPEGTSSDGRAVLPFRTSLFQVAFLWTRHGRVDVQPVTLAYAPDGAGRPSPFAWYANMEFLPHLLHRFGEPGGALRITVHPVVRARDFPDRKALARHCRRRIADALADAREG